MSHLTNAQSIFEILQGKRAELQEIQTNFRKVQEDAMNARSHYMQMGMNSVRARGSPVGDFAGKQRSANDRQINYHLQKKQVARLDMDLKEKAMKDMVSRKALLEGEIRQLQESFNGAAIHEEQEKNIR